MAITITPTLDLSSPVSEHPVFLSELHVITLHGVTEPVTITITVITNQRWDLFNNRYVPNSNGEVCIYDVDKLLEPELSDGPVFFDFSVAPESVGYNVTVWHTQVFPANTSVEEPASTFLPSFFLSASSAPRDTTIGRYELLSAYLSEKSTVTAECHYLSADNKISSQSVEIATLNPGMQTFDVSPALFAKPDAGMLVGYEIICGERRRNYRVLPSLPFPSAKFIFKNCFNCWETIYFTGKRESTPTFTRSSAVVSGNMRNYRIDYVLSHKVSTGPLRQGMEMTIIDCARSMAVFMLEYNGLAGDEVTVTDCDLKYSNDFSEILGGSFTYRLADSQTSRIHAPRPPKLFDNSFDDKFN